MLEIISWLVPASASLANSSRSNSRNVARSLTRQAVSTLALCVAALLGVQAQAQTATMYTEQGQLMRANRNVSALGQDLAGDKVSLYTGSLEFTQTDVSLPGNNNLPVSVGRRYVTGAYRGNYYEGTFVDWDLEIPHLHGVFAGQNRTTLTQGWVVYGATHADAVKRCSNFASPPDVTTSGANFGVIEGYRYWGGNFLYVPGAGDTKMLTRHTSNTAAPTDGQSYPIVTKSRWQFRCITGLANPKTTNDTDPIGEGFIALSPDGTQYRFDWMVSRTYLGTHANGYSMTRQEVWIMPTLVTDRFGNTVTYTYDRTDPWKLLTIVASDGRQLTLNYNTGHRVASVYDGTRTWTYTYNPATTGSVSSLTKVTLPDNTAWQFAMAEQQNSPNLGVTPFCSGAGVWNRPSPVSNPLTSTITHPSGAAVSFTMDWVMHSRAFAGSGTDPCSPGSGFVRPSGDEITPDFPGRTLISKSIAGPGLATLNWTYGWPAPNGTWGCPPTSCSGTTSMTVTDPSGAVNRYTHGAVNRLTEGQLVQIDEGWDGSSALRTTVNHYNAANTGGSYYPYPQYVGMTGAPVNDDPMEEEDLPLNERDITQQGVTFTWKVNTFDSLARATSVTKSNTLGISRTEVTSYFDQLSRWVIGQIDTVSVGGLAMVHNDYNASLATLQATSKFGVFQSSYSYNTDGTLASKTDGRGYSTLYSSYKRGIARTINYPNTTSQSAAVNDIGLITSLTDQMGYTTTYGYDAIGRLASVAPLAPFTATSLAFVPATSAEYGLPAGHWRQTITKGNAVTVNYFDALWRPVMSRIYDNLNQAGTRKVVVKGFDHANRPTFESYPQRDIATYSVTSPGKRTQYDTMGRAKQIDADSELGILTSTVSYPGTYFGTVETNPRGYGTSKTLWALDDPNSSQISTITAPENVSIAINRDVFGKASSITRGGNGVSVTRSYVYDAGQRLCKTIEPEVGATVQDYDASGNVAWRAPGQALSDTYNCNTGSAAPASTITYTYDPVNLLASTSYGDASPGITRTYWADGLPNTVTSNGSTWTYTYNNALRLLDTETFNYAGQNYVFARTYNNSGDLTNLSYPGGAVSLNYNPNALGEPSTVGGYASAISFQPNGAVAGYTLGNGIAHTLTQNARGLPAINQDAGVMKDVYTYDANGNVTAIDDQQESIFTRGMSYDGLDRLKSTSAPGVWGNASYTYDTVDNVLTSNVGSRNTTLTYLPGTNLLDNINVNGAISHYIYDAYGNIRTKGGQNYTFDLGNRMSGASLGGSYLYDGDGRRFKVVSTDGSTRLQMYSQGGQLLWGTSSGGSLPASNTAYIYLGGKQVAEWNSVNGNQYVHIDALGSPVAHTNGAGGLMNRSRFEPYGYVAAGTRPSPGTSVIGFTGHVQDAETELVYMQQRYYDPIAARFLSVDPIVTDANTGKGFGLYTYVENNPYSKIDPDGRQVAQAIQACARVPACAAAGVALAGATGKAISDAKPSLPGFPVVTPNNSAGTALQSVLSTIDNSKPQSPNINPADVAGKTPIEIGDIATGAGLVPRGPNPLGGQGAFVDPVTGEQRVLVHGDHAHVNDANGNRLDVNGNKVKPESPEAHLPIKPPPPPKPETK